MSYLDRDITDRPVEPVRKNRNLWLIISVVVLLMLCCCIAAAAALLYFDPFEWGVFGRLFGGYDAIASAVPADTDVYVSVDMLKLMNEDSRSVFDAFANSMEDPDVSTRKEVIQEVDTTLMESYGVTFSGDILPWIGQYAGVSLFEIDFAGEFSFENWILAVEARDRSAADAFVNKVMTHLSDQYSTAYETSAYGGAELYSLENISSPLAAGRHRNIVFISQKLENIQRAIDAAKGDSLSDNKDYQAAASELPSSRLATAYLSRSVSNKVTSMAGELVLGGTAQTDGSQSSGMALSLVNSGIQMDIITVYDLESMPQTEIDSLSLQGASGKAAGQMPQDILMLLTGRDLERGWNNLLAYLQQSAGMNPDEIHESMQLLESQIGLNPEQDLFPLLDEEWSISVVHERNTLLTEQLDMPLGLICIAETSSPDQLSASLNNAAENLSHSGLVTVSEKNVGDMTLYDASVFLMGNPLFSFGMNQNQFLLSTNPDQLENMNGAGATLSESTTWANTWDSMPGGMSPVFYLDFQSMTAALPEMPAGDLTFLQPIQTFALANSPLKGNTRHWIMLMTVETD